MESGNRIRGSLMETHSQKSLLDWDLNQADQGIRTLDPRFIDGVLQRRARSAGARRQHQAVAMGSSKQPP